MLRILSMVGLLLPASAAAAEPADGPNKLHAALQATGNLEFPNLSLEEIARRLQTKLPGRVVVHESLKPVLEARREQLAYLNQPLDAEASVEPEPPGFSASLRNMRLEKALRIFLDHYALSYALLGDTLVLATAEKADELVRAQRVDVRFEQTPLARATEQVAQRYGVAIVLDPQAPEEKPVSLALRDVTLDDAVRLIAQSAGLEAAPLDRGWLITNTERAKQWQARWQRERQARPAEAATGPALGGIDPLGGVAQLGGLGGAGSLVRVPPGLLQTAGPMPRGERAGPEPSPNQAKRGKAGPEPKTSSASEVLRKLQAPSDLDVQGPITLRELLSVWTQRGGPTFVLARSAFKRDTPDFPEVGELQVHTPNVKGMAGNRVLRLVLDQVPSGAAYLVRPGYVLITTANEARPNGQFIQADFRNEALREALSQLAEQTGISIVVDPRIEEQAQLPITARFASETNLVQAVRVLADMVELRAVVVDNIIYVTARTNSTTFPPEPMVPGQPNAGPSF